MDFHTATEEVFRVEQNAKEYVPPKAQKQDAGRPLELSPQDISEMKYRDIISQYMRLEKIISASSMDMGIVGKGAPSSAKAPSPKKVAEIEQEMQKISIGSAKEAGQVPESLAQSTLPGGEAGVSRRLPIPSIGAEKGESSGYGPKPEEAPKPPEIPPQQEEGPQETIREEPQEIPFGEELPEEKAEKKGKEEPAPGEGAAREGEESVEGESAQEAPALEDEAAREGEEPAPKEETAQEGGWEIPLDMGAEEPVSPESAREHKKEKPSMPREESAAKEKAAESAAAEIPFGFEELPDEVPSAAAAPAAKEMGLAPTIRIPVPAFLSESPLENAEAAISKLEVQVGAQMKGKKSKKVDSAETKKRMLELTRELFKERSMNRRAEIKKEIVMLKDLLTKAGKNGGKSGKGGALPEGSMYTALRSEQDYEFKEALDRVQEIYEDNRKLLVSAMDAKRAVEHREPAFDAFSKSMVDLEQGLDSLIDKYQEFLSTKHVAELEKLDERGQATRDSTKLAGTLADAYSREFSSLKNTIGEQVHSQIESTRAVLFESAGDPMAQKLSQVANAPEETVFNLLQARDSRTYEKYARGEITRAQALSTARRLMAKDAGVDEESIDKTFGGK